MMEAWRLDWKALNSEIVNDIREALADGNIPWDGLRNRTLLVTGAAGLVGGALVRVLSAANAEFGLNARVIAHARSGGALDALERDFAPECVYGDVRAPLVLNRDIGALDYIFHCAAMAKSADMLAKPADVIATMVDGTRNMLELARARECRSFVYLSSMEVYGRTAAREVCEGDLGYLDLLAPRSCYPESKRLCEAMCAAYFLQYGLPAKIARLAQTFGAGVSKFETRVFAQFARSALAGEDIELHTQGRTRGNYCYIMDAVRALLTILFKGAPGEAYNVANPAASVTIREMAEIAAATLGGGKVGVKVRVPSDILSRGYAPESDFVLNADKLMALGWAPSRALAEMFARMAAAWGD